MAKLSIPGPPERRFYQTELFGAVAELVVAGVGAVTLLWKARADYGTALEELKKRAPSVIAASIGKVESAWNVALIAGLVGLGLIAAHGGLKLLRARKKDQEAADRASPQHLLAPLLMLHTQVQRRKGLKSSPEDDLKFRATLHRVTPDGEQHQQVVRYVGGEKIPSTKVIGRSWPNSCGLVGRAVRRAEAGRRDVLLVVMSKDVASEQSYVAELMDLYGYSEEQAKKLQSMRLAALAIPISGPEGQVLGVVYCDSTDRDFFDEQIRELCVDTATAIAAHIAQLNS